MDLLTLRGSGERICTAPCSATLETGTHALLLNESVGGRVALEKDLAVHKDLDIEARYAKDGTRNTIAGWFLLPAVVGLIGFPIALVRKSETAMWVTGGLAVGGTVTFYLLWSPTKVDVQITPKGEAPQKFHVEHF
jgi:hypothetical protein